MELKSLIAKGEQVDVYRVDDLAVKLFHADYPKSRVLYEGMVLSLIEQTGLPVPSLEEVSKENGQWRLCATYLDGPTLAQAMEQQPEQLEAHIELMVDLQLRIHAQRVPRLPKLKDLLAREIESLDGLEDGRRYELMTRLESCPKHVKLCHGNLSPQNIILQEDGPYVVDWIAASQGNASADAARTYLLLSLCSQEAAERYLYRFCEKSGTEKAYVQRWLPLVAAGHLRRSHPEERELLHRWIDVVDYA